MVERKQLLLAVLKPKRLRDRLAVIFRHNSCTTTCPYFGMKSFGGFYADHCNAFDTILMEHGEGRVFNTLRAHSCISSTLCYIIRWGAER